MNQSNDAWFIRLPDGQVLRANSTEAVRHNLETGRLPRDSWVRRSPDEEWVAVEWMPELSESVPAVPVRRRTSAPRPVPVPDQPTSPESPPRRARRAEHRDERLRLQAVGTRGMVEELTTALDSALVPLKLRVAYFTGLVIALALVGVSLVTPELERPWPLVVWLGAGLGFLFLAAICASLVTQATFAELSQGRTGHWADASHRLGRIAPRLTLLYVLVFGTVGLAILVLSQARTWFPDLPPDTREAVERGATVLLSILLVLLGPLTLVAFQLAPIVVVEECSAGRALGLWWQLLHEQGRRLYLYEGLAAALALVASLPLLVPVALVAMGLLPGGLPGWPGLWLVVVQVTLAILAALAASRLIAYLLAANLFIYVNLRYMHSNRR